jgi:GMP synthase-like glutamine amidotransferase
MHRDIVFEYPEGVEQLGSSPRCSVQGMYIKNRLISVQGHPEFNEQIVRELCEARHDQVIFSDEVYQDALPRIASKHDGVEVAEGFLRFLLED